MPEFDVRLSDGSKWVVRQDAQAFPPLTDQFIQADPPGTKDTTWNIYSGAIVAFKRQEED